MRTSVLAVLADSDSPLSLASVHSRLPGVSKPAVLRWLQKLVEEGIVKRLGESYALLDPAEFNWAKETVVLAGLKAVSSAKRSGITATVYGPKGIQLKDGTLDDAVQKLLNGILVDLVPGFETLEGAKKSGEGSARLAGTKFSVIVHFDGTGLVGKDEEEVKVLRRKAIGMLSNYGPMSIQELAKELGVSPVAAYQAVHPLLVASLAERGTDGRIKLMVKVREE